MDHIGGKLSIKRPKDRRTERGELMRFFCRKLNEGRIRDNLEPITMGRMGKILEGIPTQDLYYLKRSCEDTPNFSKKFWWLLDMKKHQGPGAEAGAKAAAKKPETTFVKRKRAVRSEQI